MGLFGYELEEILGRTSRELGLWVDADGPEPLVEALGRGDDPVGDLDLRLRTKTGEIRVVQVTATLLEAEGNAWILAIHRDVTDRERDQEELHRVEALQGAILETAIDRVILMDQEGKVLEFNPASEQTFGYTRQEAVGRQLLDDVPLASSGPRRPARSWP